MVFPSCCSTLGIDLGETAIPPFITEVTAVQSNYAALIAADDAMTRNADGDTDIIVLDYDVVTCIAPSCDDMPTMNLPSRAYDQIASLLPGVNLRLGVMFCQKLGRRHVAVALSSEGRGRFDA